MTRPFLILAFLSVLACATPALHAQRERTASDEIEYVDKTWPGTKKTSTGMRYLIRHEGHGASSKPGDLVSVLYTGTLPDGTVFDTNVGKSPFEFKLGDGHVIPGFERGVLGMKVGGKRRVTIPPDLAYGKRGVPPKIPPGSILVFDIELLAIR